MRTKIWTRGLLLTLAAVMMLSAVSCGDGASSDPTVATNTTRSADGTTEPAPDDYTSGQSGDTTAASGTSSSNAATTARPQSGGEQTTGRVVTTKKPAPVQTTQKTTKTTQKTTEKTTAKEQKLIALSFDDGPNAAYTPMVLDRLKKYNVKASFFLIGNNINANVEDIMKRTVREGHELGNHSYSHSRMTNMTKAEMREDIARTQEDIFAVTGVTPTLFRPPFIAVNQDMYNAIRMTFICGIGAEDYDPSKSSDDIADKIISTVRDGDIILLHDGSGNSGETAKALDRIIPTLQSQGYEFVTVSQLFARKGIKPAKGKLWTNVLTS